VFRIRKFLSLPNPDQLVKGKDQDSHPDPGPSIIKQNSKKNLDLFLLFLTSLWLFSYE